MKFEKVTLDTVTQEHLDLLNAFFLGVTPTFTRTRPAQAAAATDAVADICWQLLDRKPKAEWTESDMDFIAQFYQNFRDGLTGARIFLNEIQAVSSAKSRSASHTAMNYVAKDRVDTDRKKAFAEREAPKPKRGAPRLSPEEKQIRAFRNIGMSWESIESTLKVNTETGLSKLTAAQISTLLENSQRSESSRATS